MSYKVEATPHFLAEAKKLSKKYPSLKNDIASLAVELSANPVMGTPLGKNAYKIRMAITSKGKGKSGGARGHYLRKNFSYYHLSCFHL